MVTDNVLFNVGDKVRWIRAVAAPEYRNTIGMVVAVFPDEHHSLAFSSYEVQFPFGTWTLYGTQIEAVEVAGTPFELRARP